MSQSPQLMQFNIWAKPLYGGFCVSPCIFFHFFLIIIIIGFDSYPKRAMKQGVR